MVVATEIALAIVVALVAIVAIVKIVKFFVRLTIKLGLVGIAIGTVWFVLSHILELPFIPTMPLPV